MAVTGPPRRRVGRPGSRARKTPWDRTARGRANHRGRIRPPSDHRLESLKKAPRGGEDGNGDGVLDDRHGHRLFSGEMGPPKPAPRSRRQSSAPLRHPTGPGVVELDEPGLDRTRAEAEDVVALTTENASDGLPSTTGSQDDPFNRRAVLGQRPDGRVHLCATKEAFVLEPFGGGPQLGVPESGFTRPAPSARRISVIDRRATSRKARLAFSIRRPRSAIWIAFGAARATAWPQPPPRSRETISTSGAIRQPGLDGGCLAVGQNVQDLAPLEIADNAAIAMPARRWPRRRRPRPEGPQPRMLAPRRQQAAAKRQPEMAEDVLQSRFCRRARRRA